MCVSIGNMLSSLRYCTEKSNLHGLKYITDKDKHWVVRIFWAIVFILSFAAMLLIFKTSYESYEQNTIRFVTETTYLEWNTTFPAVTLCPISGAEPEWDLKDFDDEDDEDVEDRKLFISDLIYFTGSCYSCNSPCKSCKRINFMELVEKYRKKCHELFRSCKWNEEEFECCQKIMPLETEYGICYSFNSLHSGNGQLNEMNRKSGPGKLWIQAIEDVRVYFHAPEDVPFINSDPDQRKDVMLGELYNISINIIEINNDGDIKRLPIEKRGCKFPWENEGVLVHKFYSYPTCVVQCHAENHINLCNCTHHLMPFYNKKRHCDIEGLKCLTDNFEIVNRLHAEGFDKLGLVCDCLPSCVEPEYNIVSFSKSLEAYLTEISIQVQSLPTARFKRIVLKSKMDMVVSIGGTAGLFIGASLLSIIETLYLLTSRQRD